MTLMVLVQSLLSVALKECELGLEKRRKFEENAKGG